MKTFYCAARGMRRVLLFLFYLILPEVAQTQSGTLLLAEQFTDGNFSDSPSWIGDLSAWYVDENHRLRSRDTTISQEIYLSTPIGNNKSAKWEFLIQMNFNPSTANRMQIYLFSDQSDLSIPLNGYYLQLGESGPDDGFDLYRQEGTIRSRILEGPPVPRLRADTFVCRFSIRRDPWGTWELRADPMGGDDFVSFGIVRDNRFEPGGFFGIKARYTQTRSDGFLFDDLFVSDPGPEPLTPPVKADWGSLLITEIFPDPVPVTGSLPEAEFFELYNTGDTTVDLAGWTWQDRSTISTFSAGRIAPAEYVIVCHEDDVPAFRPYGRVIGINPFPTLNNTGDRVILSTPFGKPIDSLAFSDQWYGDGVKRNGGFSLERISLSNPCAPETNWAASMAKACGTPGSASSHRDSLLESDFQLRGIEIITSQELEITFNSFPETAAAEDPNHFSLNNGAKVAKTSLRPDRMGVILQLEESLQPGAMYRLEMNLTSCFGIPLAASGREVEFIFPDQAVWGDVVINEILFNPYPDGADFVEIYNRSQKVLDLRDLDLASGSENDSTLTIIPISAEPSLLKPGEYRVLTRYPEKIMSFYFTPLPAVFVEMDRFPAYSNKSGQCFLLSGGVPIDRMTYRENMHFPLLADPEGVSLEKIHFDLPAERDAGFQSAAATAGYATPGYRNSQFVEADSGRSWIRLSNRLFSPERIGISGRLTIAYHFPDAGRVANVRIFNTQGRMVRHLANNVLLGTRGNIPWDGHADNGSRLQTGPYVIAIDVFSPAGQVESFRKICVLVNRP